VCLLDGILLARLPSMFVLAALLLRDDFDKPHRD
jgi:hypothetical protein